jgi:hypothetical protein
VPLVRLRDKPKCGAEGGILFKDVESVGWVKTYNWLDNGMVGELRRAQIFIVLELSFSHHEYICGMSRFWGLKKEGKKDAKAKIISTCRKLVRGPRDK